MASNAFNNLLVIAILFALFTIIYCKVTGRTLIDLYHEIKEMITPKYE